jgi:5-methylcytosine-specific restriction endonuclease McrA
VPRYRIGKGGELLPLARQPRHLDPDRRFYSTARWQRVRALQLERQPWCEDAGPDCDGPLTADHITPVSRGGARFDFGNLTTRCRFHNSSRRSDASS